MYLPNLMEPFQSFCLSFSAWIVNWRGVIILPSYSMQRRWIPGHVKRCMCNFAFNAPHLTSWIGASDGVSVGTSDESCSDGLRDSCVGWWIIVVWWMLPFEWFKVNGKDCWAKGNGGGVPGECGVDVEDKGSSDWDSAPLGVVALISILGRVIAKAKIFKN